MDADGEWIAGYFPEMSYKCADSPDCDKSGYAIVESIGEVTMREYIRIYTCGRKEHVEYEDLGFGRAYRFSRTIISSEQCE